MNRLISTLIALLATVTYCHSQNLVWAKSMGGAGSTQSTSVAVDGAGNVYNTGVMNAIADFDPGAGVYTIKNPNYTGSNTGIVQVFITKLDANGNFKWAKHLGDNYRCSANGIAADASGNSYITGSFTGTADFDPDTTSTYNLTAIGLLNNIFVLKLDSAGHFLWAKVLGTGTIPQSNAAGNAITVDISGNVYISGNFNKSAVFGATTLTTFGYTDAFVCKLNAAGDLAWTTQMGGDNSSSADAITVDKTGNTFITGTYTGASSNFGNFHPVPVSSSSPDVFVAMLDSNGNISWVKSMGGVSADIGKSIQLDGAKNVYASGWFIGSATFGTTSITATKACGSFLSKLDSTGNFLWTKLTGSGVNPVNYRVATDLLGNTYGSGSFSDTIFLDTSFIVKKGSSDLFVNKTDSSGNVLWAKTFSGVGVSIENAQITVDAPGKIYLTGYYNNTINADSVTQITAAGVFDTYILKLENTIAPLPLKLLSFAAAAQKNEQVLLSWTTTAEQDTKEFQILHSTDGKSWTSIGTVAAAGTSMLTKNYSFIHSDPTTGINYYKLSMIDIDGSRSQSMVRTAIINEKAGAVIRFAPNPAQNAITITGLNAGDVIKYYTTDGIQVMIQTASDNQIQTDISSLPPAIYTVVIIRNGQIITTAKIVKNK